MSIIWKSENACTDILGMADGIKLCIMIEKL